MDEIEYLDCSGGESAACFPTCILCGSDTSLYSKLSRNQISTDLKAVFGREPPSEALESSYRLLRCENCQIVFADPMKPGSQAFYEWLAKFERYHPKQRWEWNDLLKIFRKVSSPCRILEIGAGQGDFLGRIADLDHVTAIGIELNAYDAECAQRKDLNVQVVSLEKFVEKEIHKFDYIVLSHVLEHLGDPLGSMIKIKMLLRCHGAVVFSVPYSPMSREFLRDDIMNLPPHHLTRWNIKSLCMLANKLNADIATRMPRAKSPLKRALKQTWLSAHEREENINPLLKVWYVLKNFNNFRFLLRSHKNREEVNGRRAADTILVFLNNREEGELVSEGQAD